MPSSCKSECPQGLHFLDNVAVGKTFKRGKLFFLLYFLLLLFQLPKTQRTKSVGKMQQV